MSEHNELLVNAFVVDNFGNVLGSSNHQYLRVATGDYSLPENAQIFSDNVYTYPLDNGMRVLDIIYPVKNEQDQILCKVHFQMSYDRIYAEIKSVRFDYLKLAALAWLAGLLGLFLLIYLMMNPFRRLAEWVKQLGQPGSVDEMDIDASSEVGEIAKAFSDITNKLRVSQENLAEQERLQKEMQVAQEIQQTLLPSEFPEIEGYELSSFYEAAKEVGGDYFDFVEVDKDTLGIVVGDVSGKGVPGSLVMTMIRTALRTEARGVKDAADVLARVNDFVVNDMKKGMFVTLFYVIIDSRRRKLSYASAGHNPMILYRTSTNKTYYLNPRGFPIGISLPDKDLFRKSIESDTISLKEDDILVIYTDGVTEAMNGRRQLFGEERFLQTIREYGDLTANDFVEKLQNDLRSFTEGNPQNDDITLVSIKEKTSAEKLELKRAKKAFQFIQDGTSIKEACETAGITTYAYYNKYKEQFDSEGVESYELETDNETIEVKHLSIEEKAKIYDIIRRFPEYGAKRISEELRTEHYGETEISPSRIYEELVRARLNTKELREAFIQRGGRKKPVKPPGTPLLTIDGRVIIQKGNIDPGSSPPAKKARDEKRSEAKPSAPLKESKTKPKPPAQRIPGRDLIHLEISELLTTPIEDLLDKRGTDHIKTLQPHEQRDVEQARGENDEIDFDKEMELIDDAEKIEAESESDSDQTDDLTIENSDDSVISKEELEFAELVELGGGLQDPSDEQKERFEGQVPEDATVLEETDNNKEALETESAEAFEEFLEIEQEHGLITPEGELDADISDELLFDNIDNQLHVEPEEPEETVADTRSDDTAKSLSKKKIDFDELLSLLETAANESSETHDEETVHQASEKELSKNDLLEMAYGAYENKDYNYCISQLNHYISHYPLDVQAFHLLGNAHFRLQHYRDATRAYRHVLRLEPNDQRALENLGVIYANQGDFNRALLLWEKLLQQTPQRNDLKKSIERAKKFLKDTV
jgi:serine phosphatase RsbU (regulator of sigma subunit)/TolA-binding protein